VGDDASFTQVSRLAPYPPLSGRRHIRQPLRPAAPACSTIGPNSCEKRRRGIFAAARAIERDLWM
jgi:hypothetical protein